MKIGFVYKSNFTYLPYIFEKCQYHKNCNEFFCADTLDYVEENELVLVLRQSAMHISSVDERENVFVALRLKNLTLIVIDISDTKYYQDKPE